MQRREFITLLGGMSVAWQRAVRAQQLARRIGALMSGALDDSEGQSRLAAFLDGLQQLGWTAGRNMQIDTRWASDVGANRGAEELVTLGPDVILASASLSVVALQRITRSVPIVTCVGPEAHVVPSSANHWTTRSGGHFIGQFRV